jgi:hypothetical protein
MADSATARTRNLMQMPAGRRRTSVAAAAAVTLIQARLQGDPPPVHDVQATLSAFQSRVGLPQTSLADDVTLARIVAEAVHQHVAISALRTSKVQQMLTEVGLAPDQAEVETRTLGVSTVAAVKRFQTGDHYDPILASSRTTRRADYRPDRSRRTRGEMSKYHDRVLTLEYARPAF